MADDTGDDFLIRKNGRAGRAWLWVATTPLVTVFRVACSRGADIAREMLGNDFAGLLGTDRWSAYAWVDAARRQLCWSHLDRDFQSFIDRKDAGASIGQRLLRQSQKMFRLWRRVRDGTLSRPEFQDRMRPVRKRILALLREASVCPARKTAGMAKKILGLQAALCGAGVEAELESLLSFNLQAGPTTRKRSTEPGSRRGGRRGH